MSPRRNASRARPRPRAWPPRDGRPLFVTSAHLAATYPELSAMESGLIVAWHAFERWMVRCMTAADPRARDLTPIDVLVLHHVNHRGSAKRMADVCFVLNVEDVHVVSYSLRKLAGAGLVTGEKRGKEVFFKATAAGRALCDRYKRVRDACLVPAFSRAEGEADRLAGVAEVLRAQVGAYDQASRAATVTLGGDGDGGDGPAA